MEDDSDEKDSCSNDRDSEEPLSDDGVNGQMKEFLFMQEETRSRFTEYSMTSSVMRRNEQLTLLDDRFEKVRQLRKVIVKHKGAKCCFCLLIHLTVKMHTRWCPVCLCKCLGKTHFLHPCSSPCQVYLHEIMSVEI